MAKAGFQKRKKDVSSLEAHTWHTVTSMLYGSKQVTRLGPDSKETEGEIDSTS